MQVFQHLDLSRSLVMRSSRQFELARVPQKREEICCIAQPYLFVLHFVDFTQLGERLPCIYIYMYICIYICMQCIYIYIIYILEINLFDNRVPGTHLVNHHFANSHVQTNPYAINRSRRNPWQYDDKEVAVDKRGYSEML